MNLTAFTSRATTGLVAAVAGFASYLHITKVAHEAGEHGAVAAVLPLSIDGLILVGTLAMLEDKRDGRRPRLSARIAVGFGVVATLAANIASAADTMTARLVAAVPPIAFLIAVEVLSRRGRKVEGVATTDAPALISDEGTHTAGTPALASTEGSNDFRTAELSACGPESDLDRRDDGPDSDAGEPVPDPWRYATPIGPEPLREPVREPLSEPVAEPVRPRRRVARSLTAAERVMAAHEKEPGATHERIAKLAGVSVSSVKRHRVTGSPSVPLPAETPPVKRLNGRTPEFAEGVKG
jgi:hypothetical protein